MVTGVVAEFLSARVSWKVGVGASAEQGATTMTVVMVGVQHTTEFLRLIVRVLNPSENPVLLTRSS
eukprot:103510-Pleurochrysis_carterae.AAC.4